VFLSEAYVYHHRRKTLRAFMQQTFSYGFGRAQQTVQAPRSCHPAFLGPAAALALLLASPFSLGLRAALPGSAAIYGLLAFAGASISDETRRLGILGILAVTALTAVTHAAYGVGFWSGLGWELRRRFFMADRRTATQTSQNY